MTVAARRTVTALAIAAISLLAATAAFFLILVLCMMVVRAEWRCDAQVAVDWSKMPIETMGGTRGLIGQRAKDLVIQGLRDSAAGFAQSADAQGLGIDPAALAEMVSVTVTADGAQEKVVHVHIRATNASDQTAAAITKAYVSWLTSGLGGYGWMELLGAGMAQKRQIDDLQAQGEFRRARELEDRSGWAMLSLVVDRPVTLEGQPTLGRSYERAGRIGGALGFFAAALVCPATALLGGLVVVVVGRRARRANTRSAPSAHPAR